MRYSDESDTESEQGKLDAEGSDADEGAAGRAPDKKRRKQQPQQSQQSQRTQEELEWVGYNKQDLELDEDYMTEQQIQFKEAGVPTKWRGPTVGKDTCKPGKGMTDDLLVDKPWNSDSNLLRPEFIGMPVSVQTVAYNVRVACMC